MIGFFPNVLSEGEGPAQGEWSFYFSGREGKRNWVSSVYTIMDRLVIAEASCLGEMLETNSQTIVYKNPVQRYLRFSYAPVRQDA
jgi:hypothetical protein